MCSENLITPENNLSQNCYVVKGICDETEDTKIFVHYEDCSARLHRICICFFHSIATVRFF